MGERYALGRKRRIGSFWVFRRLKSSSSSREGMSTKIQIIDGLLNLKEAAQLNNKLRFYEIFDLYYGDEKSYHEFIGCPIDYSLDEQQPERGYGDVLYRDTEGNLHFCFLFVE